MCDSFYYIYDNYLAIYMFNFYELMEQLEIKFSNYIDQSEKNKNFIINQALSVFEKIDENQIKIINIFNKTIKEFQRNKDEKITQYKLNKHIENNNIKDEIEILEKRIISKIYYIIIYIYIFKYF